MKLAKLVVDFISILVEKILLFVFWAFNSLSVLRGCLKVLFRRCTIVIKWGIEGILKRLDE
jgi:hypothetical protein